jgi:hypothetical protein
MPPGTVSRAGEVQQDRIADKAPTPSLPLKGDVSKCLMARTNSCP